MARPSATAPAPIPPLARLGEAGRVRCELGWRLAPGWSERLTDHDLWCVWAGRGTMETDAGTVPLHPGVVIWMRPGGRYEAVQDPAARLGVTFVHFTPATAPGWAPPFEVMVTRDLGLLETVTRAVVQRRADAPAAAQALLHGLLVALAVENARPTTPVPQGDGRHRDLIEQIAARMAESPAEIASVAQLAREAGLSPDHFSRVFVAIKGLRPQAYLVRTRIDRAKQLLAETNLSVGEVAAMLRYSDVYFFSRQFRQVAGLPPSRWRRTGRP